MGGRRENYYLFKIVIIGNSGVGKSCLLTRFADNTFSESHITTIGVDYRARILLVDGTLVNLKLFDTAGQEQFSRLTVGYYRGSDAIIIVFDKNSPESFGRVDYWMEEANRSSSENTLKMMIGNKVDLNNSISSEEGQEKARSLGIEYIETSAKSSFQVNLAFMNVARLLLKKWKDIVVPPTSNRIGLVLAKEESKRQESSSCC